MVEQEPETAAVAPSRAMAVDLGLDNVAACVTTTGASFLMDGKKLKSINQWYNKQNAKYQSLKDQQGIQGLTRRQGRLLRKRNHRVRDYLKKVARTLIEYCLQFQIGTLIVGVNAGWKQGINLGSRNNQNFVQIPFHSLRVKLKSLCERYGIRYMEQEESDTSKTSALDSDELPIYDADNPREYPFSGQRVKRGLYRSAQNQLVNADCNGAWNIGRKSKHEGFARVSRGVLAVPRRIFIS